MTTALAGDSMLLIGRFAYANDFPISPGNASWNGQELASVGCGVEWDCVTPGSLAGLANPVHCALEWNGDLFLAGAFDFTRNGLQYRNIMRWDGLDWQPVGNGMDGQVFNLKEIGGDLYAAGWYTYADTVLANGLARWDGSQWHRVHDVPPFYVGGGPNQIIDVVEYQGELYIGGQLPLVNDFAKWNGVEWVEVGGGFNSAFSAVNDLKVHGDLLYVSGSFARCPPLGNGLDPGNGIVTWNGSEWDDLGGGTCGAANGTVAFTHWWNDTLYACGLFDRIGGVPGDRLAKWDGQQWCMMAPPNYWGANLLALGTFHDSLFIGGGFIEVAGQAVRRFAKWVGGDYTYACGAIVGVDDETHATEQIQLFPNPATDNVTILSGQGIVERYRVLDVHGRQVAASTVNMHRFTIERNDLVAGTYFVELDFGGRTVARKLMLD